MKTLYIGHSSRMFFNQCHKKYYWSIVKKLEPKMPATALLRGTAGHMAVDFWLTADRSPVAIEALLEQTKMADIELYAGLNEYFTKYKDEPLKYLQGLKSFDINLGVIPSGKYFDEPWEVHYCGELDGIAEDIGSLWVVERKFTKQIPSDLIGRFQLDDQTRGYSWAAHRLGHRVAGALADITRCTKNPQCVREHIEINEAQRAEFYEDLIDTAREIIQCLETGRFPMSPHSCFTFGECPYRVLCLNMDQAAYRPDSMGFDIKPLTHDEQTAQKVRNA